LCRLEEHPEWFFAFLLPIKHVKGEFALIMGNQKKKVGAIVSDEYNRYAVEKTPFTTMSFKRLFLKRGENTLNDYEKGGVLQTFPERHSFPQPFFSGRRKRKDEERQKKNKKKKGPHIPLGLVSTPILDGVRNANHTIFCQFLSFGLANCNISTGILKLCSRISLDPNRNTGNTVSPIFSVTWVPNCNIFFQFLFDNKSFGRGVPARSFGIASFQWRNGFWDFIWARAESSDKTTIYPLETSRLGTRAKKFGLSNSNRNKIGDTVFPEKFTVFQFVPREIPGWIIAISLLKWWGV